uniref:Uncharacterized protein n=1 Tax=Rhizophora mucronata TaxID=61149 RepID=A0A2P2N3Y8_RHIMU
MPYPNYPWSNDSRKLSICPSIHLDFGSWRSFACFNGCCN